jgi:predicted membrane channel-forming protein YqfA (hemolysin III family)
MALSQFIELTITPCLLVSAIGLLLLSMTNRYTHLTNRIRQAQCKDDKSLMYKRIRTLKFAILSALLAILCLCVLMIFFFQVLVNKGKEDNFVTIVLFTASLIFLLLSLSLFTFDMFVSLNSIHKKLKAEGVLPV